MVAPDSRPAKAPVPGNWGTYPYSGLHPWGRFPRAGRFTNRPRRRCLNFVGKEISYCQTCGDRLGVGEALEDQVYVHDGRRFCAACRPAQATARIPVPDRRKSSTKMRTPGPAAVRPRETTRVRKRSGVGLALLAASAVALAIGIAIAAGGGTPPPPAEPRPVEIVVPAAKPAPAVDAGPTLDERLTRIRELRAADLMYERRDEVRRMLTEASAKAGSRLEEVDRLSAEYDRAFEEAAARLADFTRSEAARMAVKQKYAEAIERLDGFPAQFHSSKAAASLKLLRDDYERRRPPPGQSPPVPDAPRRVL